jgi:hypothetical protein
MRSATTNKAAVASRISGRAGAVPGYCKVDEALVVVPDAGPSAATGSDGIVPLTEFVGDRAGRRAEFRALEFLIVVQEGCIAFDR